MAQFKVKLEQQYVRKGAVIVEADNQAAAEDMAWDTIGETDWGPVEPSDVETVVSVTRAEYLEGIPEAKPAFPDERDPKDLYCYTARTAAGEPLDVYVQEAQETILVVGADDTEAFTYEGLDRGGYRESYADNLFVVEVAEAAKESYLRGDFGTPAVRDRHLGTYCVTTRDDRNNTATNVAVVRAHGSEEAVAQVPENLRRGVVTVERVWTKQDVVDFRDLKEQAEDEISWFRGR